MMDRIANEYGEQAQIGTVAVVVEINMPDDDDGPGWTHVTYRCSDGRRWVQRGFFDAAKHAVDEPNGAV